MRSYPFSNPAPDHFPIIPHHFLIPSSHMPTSFTNFYPFHKYTSLYINFLVKPHTATLCHLVPRRHPRTTASPVIPAGCAQPAARAECQPPGDASGDF